MIWGILKLIGYLVYAVLSIIGLGLGIAASISEFVLKPLLGENHYKGSVSDYALMIATCLFAILFLFTMIEAVSIVWNDTFIT